MCSEEKIFNKDYFLKKGVVKDLKVMKKYFKLFCREKIPKNAKILDIGCGFGYFLKLCEQYGYETYGVDISKYAIEQAKLNTKSKLSVCDIEKHTFSSKDFFDVITMFDVIEHFKSPYRVLKEIFELLTPKGLGFITTPNINSLQRLVRREKFTGFTDKTHLYLFTPSSLKYLIEQCGFKVIRIETLSTHQPPLIAKFLRITKLGGEIWVVAKKG
jgi:2-polyprenyl-3-methyl-5-hydroxy-6-metoxy-1,4-benzoquinol methylase